MKKIGWLIFVCCGIFILSDIVPVYSKEQKTKPKSGEETAAVESLSGSQSLVRIAVYPVKTDGFSLNNSEVTEIGRIAMQACVDAGLRCAGRGETASNVKKEQAYGGGRIAQAQYIAEFTLVGKTKDKLKLGLPGGFHVGGGYGRSIGGSVVGGGLYTDLSGLGLSTNQMALAGQFSDVNDGSLVFSRMNNKLGMTGSFIVGEARSSNSDKLLTAFQGMFREFASRVR